MAAERQSLLCPSCRKLISVDEEACPYCGTSKPGGWLKNNPLIRGVFGEDMLLHVILYICIGMYLLSLALDLRSLEWRGSLLGIASPLNKILLNLGASGTVPIQGFGHWWSLVSANFLHGSLLHIVFNMSALFQVGGLVLQEFGVYRTWAIFVLSGVFGFYVSYLGGVPLTIGASASLCGFIGALMFYGWRRGGRYGRMIFDQTIGWVVGLVVIGSIGLNVNNWAHGGGFVGGALLAAAFGFRENKQDLLFHRVISALCLVATLAVLLWALVSGLVLQPADSFFRNAR